MGSGQSQSGGVDSAATSAGEGRRKIGVDTSSSSAACPKRYQDDLAADGGKNDISTAVAARSIVDVETDNTDVNYSNYGVNNNTDCDPSSLSNDGKLLTSPKKLPPIKQQQQQQQHVLDHSGFTNRKTAVVPPRERSKMDEDSSATFGNRNKYESDLDILEKELESSGLGINASSVETKNYRNSYTKITTDDKNGRQGPRHTSTPEWDWQHEEERILTEYAESSAAESADSRRRVQTDYPETYAQRMNRQQYTITNNDVKNQRDQKSVDRASEDWNIDTVPNIKGFDTGKFKAFNLPQNTNPMDPATTELSSDNEPRPVHADTSELKTRVEYDLEEEDLIADIEKEFYS